MSASRASARWANRFYQRTSRASRPSTSQQTWSKSQRRAYASAGDGASSTMKGDLPWAITSLVITVPSTWYLAQPQIERFKNKGKGHGHGHEEHGHKEHDVSSEGAEEKSPAEEESKPEESESDAEVVEEEGKTEGKAEGEGEGAGGGDSSEESEGEGTNSEEAKSEHESQTSGFNHASDPSNDPDKSKKAGGLPETAKVHGTVALPTPKE